MNILMFLYSTKRWGKLFAKGVGGGTKKGVVKRYKGKVNDSFKDMENVIKSCREYDKLR